MKNLDAAYLWSDEAEIAVFARNLAVRGALTAWDGRNLAVQDNGYSLDPHLRPEEPLLPIVVAAAGMALFGDSTWGARAPFAVVSLASLPLIWLLLRRAFTDQPQVALFGVAALGLCLPFVLGARQCGSYALCIFSSLWIFLHYEACLHTRHWGHVVGLPVAAQCMFYSDTPACIAYLLTLALVHIHKERKRPASWRRQIPLLLAVCLFIVGTVPRLARTRSVAFEDINKMLLPWWMERFRAAAMCVRGLNDQNVLPVLAVLGIGWMVWQAPAWRDRALSYLLLAVVNAAAVGLLLPSSDVKESGYQMSLAASVPFACAAIAIWLSWLSKRSVAWGILASLMLVTSNALGVPVNGQYRWLLPHFIVEIGGDYPTAQRAAADVILQRAQLNDTVDVFPKTESLPLIFYAGSKIRVCCTLDGDSPLAQSEELKRVNGATSVDSCFPDWLVIFGPDPEAQIALTYFARLHVEDGEYRQYRYEVAERLRVYYQSTQRPELLLHRFSPVLQFGNDEDVIVMHRVPVQ